MPAPILLFTYKRLNTLKHTVNALKENFLAKESDLYIFSDSAKAEKDVQIIQEIRDYLQTVDGFKTVNITAAVNNKGLANSIIDGVTSVLEHYNSVIVLEDDLQTTPNFLSFMNACLEKYEDVDKVFQVSGYSFNLGIANEEKNDLYFLNRGWSWGWATWKTRWLKVDWSVPEYTSFIHNKVERNNFSKGGSDLNRMLDKQMTGELDSWAIRFFFYQYLNKSYTAYPIYSKVYNNGFDGDATHTVGASQRYLPNLDRSLKEKFDLPETLQLNGYYQGRFQRKMGIWARAASKLQSVLKRLFSLK